VRGLSIRPTSASTTAFAGGGSAGPTDWGSACFTGRFLLCVCLGRAWARRVAHTRGRYACRRRRSRRGGWRSVRRSVRGLRRSRRCLRLGRHGGLRCPGLRRRGPCGAASGETDERVKRQCSCARADPRIAHPPRERRPHGSPRRRESGAHTCGYMLPWSAAGAAAARPRRCVRAPAPRCGRRSRASRVDAQWRSPCVPGTAGRALPESIAPTRYREPSGLIQDHDRRIHQESARDGNALALSPESFIPRSPTNVSYPSGKAAMNSAHPAASTARNTSSSVASGRP